MRKDGRIFIVLLGAPGAGKGTQAELLQGDFGLAHISSGDLFREHLKRGTPLGQLAQSYMDRGELVPDDVTVAMVRERLQEPDCRAGAILDGFPRTVAQAEALDALLEAMGERICAVPYVKVSQDVLLERLSGRWTCRQCGAVYHVLYHPPKVAGVCDECGGPLYQRPDDTPETQRRRIAVYLEQTAPLIAHYQARGLLVEVDGERPIEEVHAALRKAIENSCGRPS
ncbi:MAG: adenylate kinase [Anaerolineae bacterium]